MNRKMAEESMRIRIRTVGRLALIISLGSASASLALAQNGPGMRGPGPGFELATRMPGEPGEGMFAFEGMMGHVGGKILTGAPFSAVTTSEHVEKLGDGNTIDKKVTGNMARDSSGRTRRDLSLPMGMGPWTPDGGQPDQLVSITDPVTQTEYLLNITKKMYDQLSIPQWLGGDHRPMPGTDAPPQPITESLGQKSIEGLTVQGTRVTRTIQAGAIGNANPIVITSERWYSPDLQLTVLETRSDPRFGTSTFQLTSIVRSEPAAALFTVPIDYTLQQRAHGGSGPRGFAKRSPLPPGAQD